MNPLKLQIIVDAQNKIGGAMDQVAGQLDAVGKRAEAMRPAFEKMALAGTVALGAIAGTIGVGIKNFMEAERSQRQLEHAVIDVSKGTMEQVAAINELTGAMQKKAGIDADALNAGVAQLSTFGLQSQSVVDLTKSLADLTVNQSGVTAGADAYIGSANIMAKAMRGEFGMLQKMGIRFTEHQQELIKTGTETQKVAALQEGLAQNLRETTDTLAGTAEAGWARFQQGMGEASERIGKAFLPALSQLLEKVIPLIDKFVTWAEENPKLLTTIVAVAAALAGLMTVVGTIGIAVAALSAAGTALIPVLAAMGVTVVTASGALLATVGIVLGVVAAIAALIAIGVLVYKNWDEIKAKAVEIWGAIKEFFAQLWPSIIEAITNAWNGVITYLTTTWNGLSESAKGWLKLLGVIFTGGLLLLVMYIVSHWEQIKQKTAEVWEAIKNFLKENWDIIISIILGPLGIIIAAVIKNWDAIKGATEAAWGAIRDFFRGLWEDIKRIFSDAIDGIMRKIQPLLNAIESVKKGASSIGGKVGDAFKGAGEFLNKNLSVNDAIITPDGKVITTHPEDYLIATKNPGALAGGPGLTVQVMGNTFMGKEGIAREIGDEIMALLQRRAKL